MPNEHSNENAHKNKNEAMTPTPIPPLWDGSYTYNPIAKEMIVLLLFPLTAGGTFEVQTSPDNANWTTTSTQQPSADTNFSANLSLRKGVGIRVMQVA